MGWKTFATKRERNIFCHCSPILRILFAPSVIDETANTRLRVFRFLLRFAFRARKFYFLFDEHFVSQRIIFTGLGSVQVLMRPHINKNSRCKGCDNSGDSWIATKNNNERQYKNTTCGVVSMSLSRKKKFQHWIVVHL